MEQEIKATKTKKARYIQPIKDYELKVTYKNKRKITNSGQNSVKNIGQELMPSAWKVSKYGVISSPYFPVFGLNKERYGVWIQENKDQK